MLTYAPVAKVTHPTVKERRLAEAGGHVRDARAVAGVARPRAVPVEHGRPLLHVAVQRGRALAVSALVLASARASARPPR